MKQAFIEVPLDKEDAYLYPILRGKITLSKQVSIGRIMSTKIPLDRLPAAIGWLFPLLSPATKGWLQRAGWRFMLPQIFANVKPPIKRTVAEAGT